MLIVESNFFWFSTINLRTVKSEAAMKVPPVGPGSKPPATTTPVVLQAAGRISKWAPVPKIQLVDTFWSNMFFIYRVYMSYIKYTYYICKPLKYNSWNTTFLLGPSLFSGVHSQVPCYTARKLRVRTWNTWEMSFLSKKKATFWQVPRAVFEHIHCYTQISQKKRQKLWLSIKYCRLN